MRSAIRFLSCSVVVPNNRAQNSAYKNLLSTEKITTLEQRTADVARGLYFIDTQGVYEIRLGHMSTWPCKSARRFANLQTALHINKGLLHICRGLCTHTAARCTCAKRRPYLQDRLLICSAARSCAAARAYVHGRLFICRPRCTCAQLPVYLQRALHVCTAPCSFAKGRVYVQSVMLVCQTSVHVCRAACLFARPHARVHASPDHFQRKLNLRNDVWVEVTSQHGLLPETHPGFF